MTTSEPIPSGESRRCRECQAPAIRRLTATDRGQRMVSYLCGLHAAPVIHRLRIKDEAMNP